MESGEILTFAAFAVALIGAVASYFFSVIQEKQRKRTEGETTRRRIEKLTGALRESATLITEIEEEITERQALADRLQNDIKTYNELVKLRESEVEAVAQLLRGELHTQERRTFWRNAIINFIFFLSGASVTIVVALIL